jgi:hypothetical protein
VWLASVVYAYTSVYSIKKNLSRFCACRYVVSRGLEDEAELLALFVAELAGLVREAKTATGPTDLSEDAGGTLLLLPAYKVGRGKRTPSLLSPKYPPPPPPPTPPRHHKPVLLSMRGRMRNALAAASIPTRAHAVFVLF